MDVLELPSGAPRAMGHAHGEHFRASIHALAQIRIELAIAQGAYADEAAVLRTARRHLPILEAFDVALYEELVGIAEGADLDPARVVVVNHYTDLKDIAEEDCTSVACRTPDGPLLAQTWDMHGSAEPFVCLLKIPPQRDRPAVVAFSLTGCLALAGMNATGLGVTINNLKSRDAQVGVAWPALVRRMLVERGVPAAKHVLMSAPMSSGHHYLFADARAACGVETSGQRKAVVFEARWADAESAFYAHTNHCLSDEIGAVSWVSETSTSHARYDFITASAAARPIAGAADLWSRLGSHEGYPRSLCTHLATPEAPHAIKTCGAVLMDPSRRTLLATAGCVHEARPLTVELTR